MGREWGRVFDVGGLGCLADVCCTMDGEFFFFFLGFVRFILSIFGSGMALAFLLHVWRVFGRSSVSGLFLSICFILESLSVYCAVSAFYAVL